MTRKKKEILPQLFMALILICVFSIALAKIQPPQEALDFLELYEQVASEKNYIATVAQWNYYTNITDNNLNVMTRNDLILSDFHKETARNASMFDWTQFSNDTIRRIFRFVADTGMDASNDTKVLEKKSRLSGELKNIYSTGNVCLHDFGKGCYKIDTGLKDILASSRNYDEILAVWKRWRDESGKKMKSKYRNFVSAMNKAIKPRGYKDVGEYWRSWYEVDDLEGNMRILYDELKELYQHLHGYVRNKLIKYYGADKFPKSGHIPAHLLGNMWAQFWHNIYDIVEPYPEVKRVNLTDSMLKMNFNTTYMFKLADQFYTSMGLPSMPREFWLHSLLKKPKDRKIVGIASAWDFLNKKDFRILQSTTVSEDQLLVLYHEMGHIVYYLSYKNQPTVFRRGANPGFHEAVGDLVHLSLNTPEYLKTIGLIHELPQDNKGDINYLMRMALEKIAFLPFGYLIDQWRWDVFRGATKINKYNTKWWELRCKYQGISPPVTRTEADFDPGAKYHVPGNTPYIRYFISHILQFQIHKALCDEIDHNGPLHRCNLFQQKDSGRLLSQMLQLGASKPWPDALEVLTGQREISIKPLVEFFRPLFAWLKDQNNSTDMGWTEACPSNSVVQQDNNGQGALVSTYTGMFVFLSLNVFKFT